MKNIVHRLLQCVVAIESYPLQADGTIATTFTFNQDALDGPLKTYRPKGFVRVAGQGGLRHSASRSQP